MVVQWDKTGLSSLIVLAIATPCHDVTGMMFGMENYPQHVFQASEKTYRFIMVYYMELFDFKCLELIDLLRQKCCRYLATDG